MFEEGAVGFDDPAPWLPWPEPVERHAAELDALREPGGVDGPPDWTELLRWDSPGDLDLSRTLEEMAATPPGPATLTVLASLVGVRLPDQALTWWGEVLAAHQAWLAGLQASAVVEVATRVGQTFRADVTEVRLLLRETEGMAGHVIDTSRALVEDLPGLRSALGEGRLSFRHARAVLDEWQQARAKAHLLTEPLDEAGWATVAEGLQARVLGRLDQRPTPQSLRQTARRFLLRALPDVGCGSAELQAKGRRGAHFPGRDEHSVWAAVTPVDGLLVRGALDLIAAASGLPVPKGAAAAGASAEERTAEQARADAVVFALQHTAACPDALHELHPGQGADPDGQQQLSGVAELDVASSGTGGRRGVRRPRLEVGVVIDLPTLLGLAENPAELVGHGPLPGCVARALAGDAEWRRLVTDDVTGHLIDQGRTSCRPNGALRAYLLARDRTCRVPGCRRATRDLDHEPAWNRGGTTSAAGLVGRCRSEHNQKTHGHLTSTVASDGTVTFTTPLGRTYQSPPPPQLPP